MLLLKKNTMIMILWPTPSKLYFMVTMPTSYCLRLKLIFFIPMSIGCMWRVDAFSWWYHLTDRKHNQNLNFFWISFIKHIYVLSSSLLFIWDKNCFVLLMHLFMSTIMTWILSYLIFSFWFFWARHYENKEMQYFSCMFLRENGVCAKI